MRRVLFLAYLFPPIVNSGTRRSLSFANRLPEFGWQPLVLAGEPDSVADAALLAEVRPGTQVERLPLLSHRRAAAAARWLPARWRRRVAEGLAWRLQQRATVPDEVAGWAAPAVERALAWHRSQGFDAVYASGWPWSGFVAAQAIAERTGVPYLLDYRDCWIPGGDHSWEPVTAEQRARNPALQLAVTRGAASLITTTQTFAQTIGQQLGREDLQVIPNGFEPSDFTGLAPRIADGFWRIAYTGVWRPGYGLQDLYGAIARLRDAGHPGLHRLRVDAAGFARGAAREFGVEPWVQEHGPVPHQQAVALMSQADLLYLPLPEGYQGRAALAGKHFEYLGSGRPILTSAWADSETARLSDEVGGGHRIDPGDVAGLAALLARCLESGESRVEVLFPAIRQDRLARYTREATSRRLAQLLDAAVQGQQPGGLR